jgi:hypothetical protein
MLLRLICLVSAAQSVRTLTKSVYVSVLAETCLLKFTTALGFSLKNCGLFTVTLTKYRISASPGKPPKLGGSVALICCVGVFANSGIAFEKETFEIGLFDC